MPPPSRPQAEIISSAVFGTLIFTIAEAMLFAGLISAYMIAKTSSPGGWPPPGQPQLPVEAAAINTAALLASGALLAVAHRTLSRAPSRAWGPLLGAIVLGTFFVVAQAAEWVVLVREGLTLTSSNHGGFFYLIVGLHGLHAIGALAAMSWAWIRLRHDRLASSTFHAVELFWYFVVGLWPILYVQVFLGGTSA